MRITHHTGIVRRLLLAGAMLFTALLPAGAGTIEVTVRERDGAAVQGQQVRLAPHPATGSTWQRYRHPRMLTDSGGTVRFDDVKAGSYTFDLGVPPVVNLLLPEDNPYAELPVVTLAQSDSAVAITIELWRGVPIVLDLRSIDADLPSGKFILTHLETGKSFETPFTRRDGSARHVERAVVEGRWRATLDVPPGYVIPELVVNGEALPGPYAEVNTAIDPRTQYVSWEISAPAEVWGRLIAAGDALPRGSTVVATLLEPGPWLASETLRGRAHTRVGPHWWEPNAEFHIRLPEGHWRIAPEAAELESSDPPYIDLQVGAGTVVRQDFTLEGESDGSGAKLRVEVVDPNRNAGVGDAFVALYRSGSVGQADPLRTGRTKASGFGVGSVVFQGVGKGDYELVAGHPDWLDGRLALEFDPDDDSDRPRPRVVLGRGALLRVLARADEGDQPVSRVEISAEWLAEEYPSPLTDERLDDERRHRVARTDTTGYATIRGLVDGTYRIAARVTGEQQATRYARLRRSGLSPHDTLDLNVIAPREHDLDALIYEGASIVGTIRCDDTGPVPPSVDFRAYTAADPWGGIELGPGDFVTDFPDTAPGDADREPDPALQLAAQALGGRHLDQFVVGPFEPGAYVLALRPESYEGWSWIYGSDLRDEAAVLQLNPGEPTDVGTVDAVCAPGVLLRPWIESGEAVPDMTLGRYEVEATRRLDSGDEAPVYPTAEPRRGHVLVRALEPGSTDLQIEIRHPYLVPPRVVHEAAGLDLDRGSRAVENVAFRAVGGALRVHTTAAAVRLRREERLFAAVEPRDGVALVEGIFPGDYLLDECADAACDRVIGESTAVQVEARRTRAVRLGAPE